MSKLGWCIANQHEGCKKEIYTSHQGFTGRGRTRKEIAVYSDEPVVCDCKCHKPKEEKPKRRRRRK